MKRVIVIGAPALAIVLAVGALLSTRSLGEGAGEAPTENRAIMAEAAPAVLSGAGESAAGPAPIEGHEIVRTAELQLLADDPDRAFEAITAAVQRAGGFVASAHVGRAEVDDDRPFITMTVRVPVARMMTVVAEIESQVEEVQSKVIGSRDVTAEFTDLESRLRNLEALEVQLLDLLAEVRELPGSDASDLLAVFERIRSVREEIELLRGRQQVLVDQVELATVQVTLAPTTVAAPVVDDWAPAAAARDALRSLVDALQWLSTGLIWLGLFALPIGLVLAVPGGLGWWTVRRARGPSARG
jgi:hypothetical protein